MPQQFTIPLTFHKKIQNTRQIVGIEQDSPPFATGLIDKTARGLTAELWRAVVAESDLNYHIRFQQKRFLA